MSLVEDQETARAEVIEPDAHGGGVGFVDQQPLGNEEAWESVPWIDRIAAFAADAFYIIAVQNLETETKAGIEFVLPLLEHGRRAGNDNIPNATAKEQFGSNEAGLDG